MSYTTCQQCKPAQSLYPYCHLNIRHNKSNYGYFFVGNQFQYLGIFGLKEISSPGFLKISSLGVQEVKTGNLLLFPTRFLFPGNSLLSSLLISNQAIASQFSNLFSERESYTHLSTRALSLIAPLFISYFSFQVKLK